MEIDVAAVAGRLRECAGQRGLSQSDLARESGLSPAAVSRYFSAARLPSPGELLALARCFGVSMEWLLTGSERDSTTVRMQEERVEYRAQNRAALEEAARLLEDLAAKFHKLEGN